MLDYLWKLAFDTGAGASEAEVETTGTSAFPRRGDRLSAGTEDELLYRVPEHTRRFENISGLP